MIPRVEEPPSSPAWSSWNESECDSGCIRGGVGFAERRRTCLGGDSCPGLSFDVALCKDSGICEKKLDVSEWAGLRCQEFSRWVLDAAAPGLQAGHEHARPWVACAVFCARKGVGIYYTPKEELHRLGIDPYFPDGTWCHADGKENYFCRRNHCLPESFR